jgi:hypothetical protein
MKMNMRPDATTTACKLASQIEERLLERNQLFESFFSREAPRLAEACREMSERFLRGGRLLAFGRGPLRHRRAARFGGVRSSRDRGQACLARARSIGSLSALARSDPSS